MELQILMRRNLIHIILGGFMLFLTACDETISLDLPQGDEDIVIYGYIEQDSVPVVSLTKSLPVFATIDVSKLQKSFVQGAQVTLDNGDTTIELQEYSVPIGDFNYRFYSVPPSLYGVYKGEVGKTYDLTVQAEGKDAHGFHHHPYPGSAGFDLVAATSRQGQRQPGGAAGTFQGCTR